MPTHSKRMNSLLYSATVLPGHRSAGDCDQADPDREDATTTALVEQEADGDGYGSGGGCSSGSADTVVIGAAMTTAVVDHLLRMGLQEDALAETVIKVHALTARALLVCKEDVESRL